MKQTYSEQAVLVRKDKSKAEQGVQGIQRWILAHQTFFSVDELNDAISLLLDKYNNKIVKRFNKSRFEMFLELDKPFLQSLPNERYIYKEFKEATVSQSYHIFLEGCKYSVPYKYLGFKVFVAYSNQSVLIYYKEIQIALHPKLNFSGQTSTLSEHMPTNHQYVNEKINRDDIPKDKEYLRENTEKYMLSLQNNPQKVANFFKHQKVQYAS